MKTGESIRRNSIDARRETRAGNRSFERCAFAYSYPRQESSYFPSQGRTRLVTQDGRHARVASSPGVDGAKRGAARIPLQQVYNASAHAHEPEILRDSCAIRAANKNHFGFVLKNVFVHASNGGGEVILCSRRASCPPLRLFTERRANEQTLENSRFNSPRA